MSVFKKLSKADVTNVLYAANKQWDLPYTCFSSNPYFNIYKGTYITGTFVSEDASVDPVTNGEYERLIYDSMNHMFYQAYNGRALDTGSLMFNVDTYESASQQRPTQSYFDYNVNPRLVKNYPTGSGAGIRLLSIEQDIYGSKVLPHSFKLTSSVYFIVDDGNGNLYDISKNLGGYISGSYFNAESYFLTYDPAWNTHVGNIFYAHGLATITESDYQLMFPLPPLAYNDSASFLDTDSPKTIDILSNDIARSCAIDTGSVVISGSNSPYYTVNANGTLTLSTAIAGSYDIYYTVDGLCNSGCSMTSNKAKVRVNVTTAPPTTTTTTTTSTTTTTTTAPTTTTSTTTTTTTSPTTTTSTTTSTTTLDCGISGSAVETTPTTSTTTSTTTAGIATFTGDFNLCVQAGSTADYRAQDGSATSGHFTTTSTITAPNCSGPVNVTGSLTSAQGPLIILVPSVPSGNTAAIVAQGIGATNATITTAVVGGVLRIIITPNSYPTTVTLNSTLTVTFP
jgi:hypothetical protein